MNACYLVLSFHGFAGKTREKPTNLGKIFHPQKIVMMKMIGADIKKCIHDKQLKHLLLSFRIISLFKKQRQAFFFMSKDFSSEIESCMSCGYLCYFLSSPYKV